MKYLQICNIVCVAVINITKLKSGHIYIIIYKSEANIYDYLHVASDFYVNRFSRLTWSHRDQEC